MKVGERLQQRRKQDEYMDHNGYLNDDYVPDPIDESDQALLEKLNMNKEVADKKTEQVSRQKILKLSGFNFKKCLIF